MMADVQSLLGSNAKYAGEAMARPWGIRERLVQQKETLTASLNRVQAAIDALDAQPGVEALLEAVVRAL